MAQFRQTHQKHRLFTVFEYRAKSWYKSRIVIAKAEASRNRTDLRFVVTHQWGASDRPAEEQNHELKNGLSMDRLSCHHFIANLWRLLLYVHAYNLLSALRDSEAVPVELQHARPARLRTRLIEVAA